MNNALEIYVYRTVGLNRSFSLYQTALSGKTAVQVVDGYQIFSGGVLGDADSDAYCLFQGFDQQDIIGRFSYPSDARTESVEIVLYRKITEGLEVSYAFHFCDVDQLFQIDRAVTTRIKKRQTLPNIFHWTP